MANLALDPIKKRAFHSGGGKARMDQLDLDPTAKFGFHSGGGRASSSKDTVHAKHRQRPRRLPPGTIKGKCRNCGRNCGKHSALCKKGRGCNNPAGKGKG